jgi:hypothetical protein
MADKKLILRKLLILLILMFVLDMAIGAVLKHFFFAKKSGFDSRANYVINQTKADVLIFGSSKASEHYNPTLLRDSLKLSVYNAGRDLSYIYYHYALLEAVLKRYTPKLIILDTRPDEFKKFEFGEDRDRLNVLLPYYDSHPEIRDVCLLRSKFERYKLLSKMYPYNSLILQELVELLPIAKYQKDDSDNGYIVKHGEWKGPKRPYNVNDEIDTLSASYFKKFVEKCKEKKIELIVTYSPLYQSIDAEKNRNINYAYQVCKQNNVPVFNYLNDTTYNNPKLFYDDLHLNQGGSIVFSNSMVGKIREVLKGN